RDDFVAMVALNLDDAVFDSAARAAQPLEFAGDFLERAFGYGHAVHGGHRLAATAAGLAPYADDAIAAGCGCLRCRGGDAANAGRVNDSAVTRAHGAKAYRFVKRNGLALDQCVVCGVKSRSAIAARKPSTPYCRSGSPFTKTVGV